MHRLRHASFASGPILAAWGLLGIFALLGSAIRRLAPVALAGLREELSGPQVAFAAAWLVFMCFFEGYRGFQRGFAPRVVARAVHLSRAPSLVRGLLAPFFCIGLFGATRRRLVTSWAVTAGIVLLIAGVRHVAQPWRGLVDVGVVAGLTWGVVAIATYAVRAVTGRPPPVAPEVPL